MKAKPVLLVIVLMVAVIAAGEYYAGTFGNSGSSELINITIYGGSGVGTVDRYDPNNFTVKLGQSITLAILNTDDNTHGLVMRAYGIDTGKILPGHTDRITFVANQTGTFEFYEPAGYCTGGYGNVCNSVQHMTGNMTVAPQQ